MVPASRGALESSTHTGGKREAVAGPVMETGTVAASKSERPVTVTDRERPVGDWHEPVQQEQKQKHKQPFYQQKGVLKEGVPAPAPAPLPVPGLQCQKLRYRVRALTRAGTG